MAQSIEREVIYKLRVEGAEGVGASFQKAAKAATEAAETRIRQAKRAKDSEEREAESIARFEQRVANDTYRLRMKLWNDQKRERENLADASAKAAERERAAQEKAANDAFRTNQRIFAQKKREQERAVRDAEHAANAQARAEAAARSEAESSARRAENLQEEATHKLLSGTTQGIHAMTSLLRSAVLLWVANEEEADKMLKTLAGFEAGAQLFDGLIHGIQALVTLWEAAEAATKAYAAAQAAATASRVAAGVTGAGVDAMLGAGGATSTVAAGAGGVVGGAAGGGVLGVIGSVMSAIGGFVTFIAGAFASVGAVVTGVVAAIGLAISELIYRVTGFESFSVGGAAEGLYKLAGFGYTGKEGVEAGQKKLSAGQESYDRKLRALQLESQRAESLREANDLFSITGSSYRSRAARHSSQAADFNSRFAGLQSQYNALEGVNTPRAAAMRDSVLSEMKSAGEEGVRLIKQAFDLQRELAQKEVERLQNSIRFTEAASDAANRAKRQAEENTLAAASRISGLSAGDRAGVERAAKKVMEGKELTAKEASRLSGYDSPLIEAAVNRTNLKVAGDKTPSLLALLDKETERRADISERARKDEDAFRAKLQQDKALEVRTDVSGKITLIFDDAALAAQFNKIIQQSDLPGKYKKSVENYFNNQGRAIQQAKAEQP